MRVLSLTNSNVTDEQCPVCDRLLRYKGPCCNDKNSYLVCPCGFKKVREVKVETDSMHNSGGGNDSAGV